MSRSLVLFGLGLMMLLTLPSHALAASTLHYFDCKNCHKAGMAIGAMGATNTCLQCHANSAIFTDSTPAPAEWYDGVPGGRFNAADLNDLFGAATAALGAGSYNGQTHAWGVSDVKAEAGAKAPDRANPLYAGFYSRYNASTGKVTCSRCHNPHGDAAEDILDNSTGLKTPDLLDNVTRLPGPDGIPDGDGIPDVNILANPQLLIRDATNSNAPMQPDTMCRGCHVDLDKPDSLVVNTHPMVTDYASVQAASPNNLRTQAEIDTFTTDHASKIQFANGGVGCVSCHDVHYTDSDSTTADGLINRAGLNPGSGELLRSDGPNRTGADRNTAVTGTAQLRSNLCQSCHKYELHGQGLSGDHMLGCLDCHNGHDPVGNPSDYMLRSASNGLVPTRPDGTNSVSDSAVTFNDVNFTGFTAGDPRHNWADDAAGTAYGFCERCHGDVNSGTIGAKAAEHLPGNANACTACHKHNDPANLYSFNRDATAATCGQCHGFPPHLNSPGDRPPGGTGVDGGYAINTSSDPNTPYDYVTSTTHEKDETTTGHKVHAGRDLPIGPANTAADDWYFVGSAGIDNCKVCHGPDAGSSAGGHREAPATRPNTFRDVPFDGIAKTGGMSPVYNATTTFTCDQVYCHTNGAPYNGASRPSRTLSFVNTTPPWAGTGTNYAAGGYGSIHGQANECADCHGNDTTSMTSKSNSTAHQAHLGGATTLNLAKTFSCSVCHVQTAASDTALAIDAMDGRTGGKHVNGIIDVTFDAVGFNTELSTSTYTAGTGVCATYCHNVANQGGEVSPDWDITTDMQCDSCHGGLATDSSGNGGAGPITTGSHTRHILTTGTGPKLSCEECHDTGASTGTHAGHIDGVVTMKVAVNTATFGSDSVSICKECHGYDAEAGEVLPVWGNAGTKDCATCHAGLMCGAIFNGMNPPSLDLARLTGHNRPTGSGAYAESGNPAANQNCSNCHVTDSAGHWNGVAGDDFMLQTTGGFPATYAGSENAFCGNCHGAAGSATKKDINTHQSKLCVACHNVHGSSNIQMIWATQAEQISNDPSATGKFSADVFFTNVTNFAVGNTNSYDEDDGGDGGVTESNSDDVCATCHTSAGGSAHNNSDNTDSQAPTGHNLGKDCFTCHATHTDGTNAFKIGVGTACNDCHGFPPATGAHRNGNQLTDQELHSNTASNDKDVEDRTDCAWCHTGADQYTYDLTADQAAGGARGNHAKGQSNRQTVLASSVGYSNTNFNCTSACHASSVADGAWTDTTGLNCNACHYYSATPTSAGNVTAGNSEAVSTSHNKHFDKSKVCTDCHTVENSGNPLRGQLGHVIAPDYSGAGNDGTLLQGRANASLNEATVVRSGMTFDDPNNTCSGGITTGCHASGTPDWDVPIPATGAGCVMCHTETNTAAYNPTSGLHDNSPSGPTVTGNSHDGSFDDGSAGTADCVTCHSTSPTVVAANHINGTLNTGAAITVQAIAGYTQATGTCATTCHSVGTTWTYKWSTSAYATDGSECGNCHGTYATGWNTGVAPHTENPTRGNKHNSIGNLTYPCSDCHGIGSAGYKWTSKWDPTGTNSNHGDDKITMNQVAGTNTFAIDTVPNPDRAGCTTTSCHSNDAAHTFQVTTTALTTQTVTGNAPSILCSSCHGGYAGTSANGYWPDGVNAIDNGVEDNSGAHQKHITALALAKYGETLAQLLTDNGNGTADAKQKFLCAYCHNTPGADGDHGIVANLPAEVNSMYALWDLTQSTADNGFYNRDVDKTCATVDCHNNKTTPTSPTSYTWYSGSTSACIMCHIDVTDGTVPSSNGGTHVAHTSAATNFGKTIVCNDCHRTASETVAWGSPGTPPTSNHMNGTFLVSSNVVTFTYSAGQGCGTNACHNAGDGVTAPVSGATSYPWGTALANCSICHAGTPTSVAHPKHVNNNTYVSGSCADCHDSATTTQITAVTHIDGTKNVGGGSSKISSAPGNGSCINTCHLAGDAGDWTGGSAALACTDCHSGSGASAYIGGDKTSVAGPNYMPQYNMHPLTPTVSGKKHDNTLTACTTCHTTITAQTTHVNGTWTADDADNTNDQNRGLFATYVDADLGGSCSGSGVACHADGGSWTRKWKATVTANDGSECANCHGDFTSGWNAGVGHAVNPTRGNSSTHNDTGTLSYECTACHVVGATTGNYPWTSGTNDWAATDPGATTLHGDGKLTMNNNGTSHSRNENPVGTWKSGCAGCHDGPSNDGVGADDANHDFPVNIATAPSTVRWALFPAAGDAASSGGGCDGCHNSGTAGEFWPGHLGTYPSRGGKHLEHVKAIALSYFGSDTTANRNNSCDFCHLDPGSSVPDHKLNNAPTGAADVTGVKRITNKAVDLTYTVNGQGTNYVTCSSIDCHFSNAVTPHWYTDDIAPDVVTLTAVAGPNPRSIKVTWNAPGDDAGVDNTTPYVYDMRYGTSAAIAQNFGLTTNYVGGLPAAYIRGSASEVIVEDLNPGTTYYFSLKTRDTAGNWSAASAAASAQSTADTQAPEFGGADKAVKGDEGESINLYWTAAEDHTMPITYKIWLKDEAAGALDMNTDLPIITGWTDTKIELNNTHGVANDSIYHMGVRACDGNNNCDTNIQTVSATPTAAPTVDKTYHTYATNGSLVLQKDVTGTTPITGTALPAVLAASANLTYPVVYYADTFAIYLDTQNSAGSVTATLGYSTNGTNFTSLGVSKTISHGSRADRVYQFKLVDVVGKTIAAGQRLAIQITDTGATGVKINYGNATYRGDITVAERIVNQPPTAATNNGTSLNGAIMNIQWNPSTDTADGVTTDVVHYDLYGSNDGGTTYKYVIKEGLDAAVTSYQWDTQTAGITSGSLAVRINAGDGYEHTTTNLTGLGTATSTDKVAPSAIDDLVAYPRPKSGSVLLKWTAQGDDYGNHGRAEYYDIRYDKRQIVESGGNGTTTVNFADIPLSPDANGGQAFGEPHPDFGGHVQKFEVTGLDPNVNYYFAIKTVDEASNASPLSTAKSAGTDQAVGGPRCGMCHTTAPSVVESVGNHKLHGFTLHDCTHCHGAVVESYALDHQDGQLTMGFGPSGPVVGVIAGNQITYTEPVGSYVMYQDTNGFGGFGNGDYASVGDGIDNGNCFNFGAMGVGGCHGPAGTDPDAGGPLPTYATPNWNAAATLDCAQCHGNPSRTTDETYNRAFDGTTANGDIVPDQILGAPLVDNHGNYVENGAAEANRKYIGKHEKHLNYSFRFSKGDSCNLCHEGDYADRNDLDGRHANGEVDVKLDVNAAGENAVFTPGTATTAGTCSNMSPESCHPSSATPSWDSSPTNTFDCRQCHGMAGVTPSHVTDPTGSGFVNDGKGNCTWCHFGGHPRTNEGGAALILANSTQVGINYKSGGIHIRASIGGRAAQTTEAQLCWTCHDANGISEWGTDTGSNNASTRPANASDYNYGQIYTSTAYSTTTSNWTAGYWKSSVTNFDYKKGAIQSTHSTNELGTSAVTGSLGSYTETKDTVDKIRCSNCHDVHNLNKAPGDTMTGQPYLRGTWIRNPYPEDGAPWGKSYVTVVTNYANPPRAGGNEQGGYQIDQNNNSPTAGLSVATSAGLCMLCHGSVGVDNMDKTTGESLWVGTNGHSNATLGGTGSNAANIFGFNIGGRPAPNAGAGDGVYSVNDIEVMGMQVPALLGTTEYGYGYRGGVSGPGYAPTVPARKNSFNDFVWGVSVDASTIDIGYHAFTCSKCHNPHASRLPKLMITNCLDTKHNTWQSSAAGQGNQTQSNWVASGDRGEKAATWNTAQNCHRLDPNGTDNAGGYLGGWNKVTPW